MFTQHPGTSKDICGEILLDLICADVHELSGMIQRINRFPDKRMGTEIAFVLNKCFTAVRICMHKVHAAVAFTHTGGPDMHTHASLHLADGFEYLDRYTCF